MLQSAKRQERMVDCSQPIAGNYDDFAAQLGDQVPCGKALSQGHEQTADSLNEQALATPGDSPDSPQDFRQAYEAMMSSGGNSPSCAARRNSVSERLPAQKGFMASAWQPLCRR